MAGVVTSGPTWMGWGMCICTSKAEKRKKEFKKKSIILWKMFDIFLFTLFPFAKTIFRHKIHLPHDNVNL